MNVSTLNDPRPSLLAALRNSDQIPSTSWAYRAGAFYQAPKVLGSLTLGVYDTTRLVQNNVSFMYRNDQSRNLLAGIQSITLDSADFPLLSAGIYALIGSLVPDLCLPLGACQAFEQAFGLVWNDTAKLHLLSDVLHTKFMQ